MMNDQSQLFTHHGASTQEKYGKDKFQQLNEFYSEYDEYKET